MKDVKFLFVLIVALICATSLCGCLSDDEYTLPKPTIDPVNWLESQFQFKADGSLDFRPLNIFDSTADVQKYLIGNGWKHIESHLIKDDGKIEQESYYENMYGATPISYYFNDTNTLTEIYFSDEEAGRLVNNLHTWEYLCDQTLIVIDQEVSATPAPNVIQIVEAKEQAMWIIQLIGLSNDKPLYALSLYGKMTDKEKQSLLITKK